MTSDEITFDRVVLVIIETKREQVKNYIENTSILNYSKRSNPAASIFIMAVGFPLTMLKAGSWWAEVGCESFIQILIDSYLLVELVSSRPLDWSDAPGETRHGRDGTMSGKLETRFRLSSQDSALTD